ncbi:transaldolase [Sediminivirga luteola]|uniref:Transaldolase n=1 Tax=Sediminivirga luteola TaxID=1774748 RepID=A0A8J2TZY8_9MICO|nr:transaldolase [Sediminivirga luteola]MCI2264090.1 transaldolase [Sediminivirga luteola]GGA22443.1 transaldolase [Sediminivirga luteola]
MSLSQLSAAGVSVWLDDLSRERIESGNLQELIDTREVVGITTNPTIFAQALRNGAAYETQVRELAAAGTGAVSERDVDEAVFAITTRDVAAAAEVFAPLYESTQGKDGRVSIEVDPRLAHDTEGTVAAAKRLWETIGKPNVMIKIPATEAGLPAITEVIAAGISVNVTLVFSLQRYRAVVEAYLAGLERAQEAGIDLSAIRSVASIFVSRVDTEVDKRLEALGTEQALQLRGKAGIANSVLAYQIYQELFSSARWDVLQLAGAHPQRPLWASTGVKNPDYPDTMYVTGLVAPNTVNTMPEATLEAFADHGTVEGDVVSGRGDEADAVLDALAAQGIDYAEVAEVLEREGLEKFDASWAELLQTVRGQLEQAR